jgi:BirA family biotin operon repressor/biotin-[acetyl-CoA-carboxylase] ligase
VGLVVAEAIERWVGAERVTIKWPNDVLLAGRKVGGILCEGVSTRGGILGVGINVLQEPEEFPPEIRESATSLAQHADLPVDRGQLAGVLIEGLKKLGAESSLLLESAELGRISARDALLDRPVITSGGVVGRGKGITPEGTLLIQDTRGQVHSISSGTVRIREPAS